MKKLLVSFALICAMVLMSMAFADVIFPVDDARGINNQSSNGLDLKTSPELSQLVLKNDEAGSSWLQMNVSSPKEVRSTAFSMEAVDGELGKLDGLVLNISIDGSDWKEVDFFPDEGTTDRLEGLYKTNSIENLSADSQIKARIKYRWSIPNEGIVYSDWSNEALLDTHYDDKTSEKEYDYQIHGWATEEMSKAELLELIPDTLKKADLTKDVTREEFAAISVNAYKRITGKSNFDLEVPKNPFSDTNSIEVLWAYGLGITKGTSETEFSPNALITREQMAAMMTRVLNKIGIDTTIGAIGMSAKFNDHESVSSYAIEPVYYMSSKEIIKGVGDNTFNPKGNATREQAIIIAVRMVGSEMN
ncbi:MAG: S-layer homology domain-containing protein [Clostridia bacterium]|nr:S-layer homology domain-containing protein [Clostridia bacterium]